MKTLFTHILILIFWALLGIAIYIWEENSGLSGGFLGKHLGSSLYFLAFTAYAVITTIAVVVVGVVKYRRQQTFTTGNIVLSHILTATVAIGVAYGVNAVRDAIKYRQFNERLQISKELAKMQCPDIQSWQWIQVSNELALAKFTILAKANTSIALHQFSGYKAQHFFQLRPALQKFTSNLQQGKTYTLLTLVSLDTMQAPYSDDYYYLRIQCGDSYIAFSASQNHPPADNGYLNNQPVIARKLVPVQEVALNDEYRKLATRLTTQKISAELNVEIPMAPKTSAESLDAIKSDINKVEKHSLLPSPAK